MGVIWIPVRFSDAGWVYEGIFNHKAAVFFVKRVEGFLGGIVWIPEGVGFDQDVEDAEQLAHAGDMDDFEGLARFHQSLGESLDDGIHAFRRERGHVKHIAQLGAPAANSAFAAELAAVAIEGSDTYQGRDLASIQLPQLRQLRQEGEYRDLSHSRNAGNDLGLLLPLFVRLHEFFELSFDLRDLLAEQIDHLFDRSLDRLEGSAFLVVFLDRTEFDQLPSAEGQFLDLLLFFRVTFLRAGAHSFGKTSQHLRVESIRFGQEAFAFGEITRSPRIDNGDLVSAFDHRHNELPLIDPRGLDDDQARTRCGQLCEKLFNPGLIIGQGQELLLRRYPRIERLLSNINPYESNEWTIHDRNPFS